MNKKLYFQEKAIKHFKKLFHKTNISADKSNEIRIKNNSYVKMSININGKNNKITICAAEGTGKISINVIGDNNELFIGKIICHGRTNINSYCSNGKINIYAAEVTNGLTIYNGCEKWHTETSRGEITIGEGTIINSCLIFNPYTHARINIGQKCILTDSVSIYNTDTPKISDVTGSELFNIINETANIDIGDNVKIEQGAIIKKNANIGNNTIVEKYKVVPDTPTTKISDNTNSIMQTRSAE